MPVRGGGAGGTGTAIIVTGTYTGDGATSQAISGLGITPKYVRIWEQGADTDSVFMCETTPDMIDDDADGMAATALPLTFLYPYLADNQIIALASGSFTVDDGGSDFNPNTNTVIYNYMAIGE